ncbi:MAG: hypothetical protein ABI867_19405 [Kofleriaceae bacterium]
MPITAQPHEFAPLETADLKLVFGGCGKKKRNCCPQPAPPPPQAPMAAPPPAGDQISTNVSITGY